MKKINVWRLLFSLLLFSPFLGLTGYAQLSDGKVYNFGNVGNDGHSLVALSAETSIEKTDVMDYDQLWYVTKNANGTYQLRNLGTGRYLRSSNQTSVPWTLAGSVDANCKLRCVKVGKNFTFRASNDDNSYGFMHYASGPGKVVCWENGNTSSQWTITEVAIDAAELEKNWQETDALNISTEDVKKWSAALEQLFTSDLCSELSVVYANYTKAQMEADANYQALPATLQQMVLKMLPGGTWDEKNVDPTKPAWDGEYAKRLRVQLIEPHNNKESAALALGMNAHAYLNNPLGLYAKARQVLYIMVEGKIKDGSSLYLATWVGHNKPGGNYDEGYQLHEGLNVVPVFTDNTTGCLNYVVQTMNTVGGRGNKACVRRLSDYDDLKVHVEGGVLNGFFNGEGDALWGEGDENSDWDYYAARATHTALPVVGKYVTLHFPFHDADTEGNKGTGYYLTGKNIVKTVLQEWDNVVLSQRMLMGLSSKASVDAANATWKSPYSGKDEVISYIGDATDGYACDYSDYYNVRALAFGVGGSTYMYGSWDHSGYHYNTMGSILSDIVSSAGSHWGPAHEIGHQHQAPLTLNGLTEVTNNLFSNVAYWYYGRSTSRVNGTDGALEHVAEAFNTEGGDFYTNNIWGLTHMYYRLFLYYHVLGHNTEFYPRLYEMLRQDPMVKAYQQDGAKGLLHFYKKCCFAAEEDLTEFFRAHGLLTPMTERLVGDYSNSIYNTTQKQIDDAIKEVKAKGYKENVAALFINDATGEEVIGSTGLKLELYDGSKTADVGNYAYFYVPAEDYTYTVSGNNVNMKGKGGVGFIVRSAEGKVLAFSNKKKMIISDEVAKLLVKGEVKVEVVNGDNTFTEAEGDLLAVQRSLLKNLLSEANDVLELSDETQMKVGFYRSEMLVELAAVVEEVQIVYNEKQEDLYGESYEKLYAALEDLRNNSAALINVLPGSVYTLENVKSKGYMMSINSSSKKLTGERKNAKKDAQKWIFESTGTDGVFYIKNKITQTYVDALPNGKQGSAASTTPQVGFKLIHLGNGALAVQCQNDDAKSLNYNSSIGVLGWDYEGDQGSWWYITAVELNEDELNKSTLDALISQTQELLTEMGENVILPGKLPLQTETKDAAFWLSSNADQNEVGTAADGGGVAALLDNNTSTYFHSQWSGTAVKSDHYLQVDLGEGGELAEFAFTYATRKADNVDRTSPAPTTIKVYGSNDGVNFKETIATFKSADKKNPLPSYRSLGAYWTSSDLVSETAFRYLRFAVTGSEGPGSNQYGGRYFFAMSEFGLINPNTVVNSLKEKYAGAEKVYKDVADSMYDAMQVSANEEATSEEVAEALAMMKEKYAALVAAANGDVGIDGVAADSQNHRKGIFDLSGRRLNKIVEPGIYVIDGQKRYVK